MAFIRKEVETVVDENTGLIKNIETVTSAVTDEQGRLILRKERREVTARIMPQWIQRRPLVQRPPQRRAALTDSVADNEPHVQRRTEERWGLKVFRLCLFPFFIPCLYSRKLLFFLLCSVIACVATGAVFIGFGPVQDCGDYYFYASVLILVTLAVVVILSFVCVCFSCYSNGVMESYEESTHKDSQTCLLFIACLFAMTFLLLVAVDSALIFDNIHSVVYSQCHYGQTLLAAVCFAYGLIMFFSSYWCMMIFKVI